MKKGLEWALGRRRLTGQALEILLGLMTFCGLVNRMLRCCCHDTYQFVNANDPLLRMFHTLAPCLSALALHLPLGRLALQILECIRRCAQALIHFCECSTLWHPASLPLPYTSPKAEWHCIFPNVSGGLHKP